MDEQSILELAQERENLRLPKRNNVKRKRDDSERLDAFGDRIETQSVKSRRAELQNLACADCGARACINVNDSNTEYCCSACGLVSRLPAVTVAYSDSVYPRAAVSACLNYFKERMSQWCRREPPIPRSVIEKLRETYRALRNGVGPMAISDFINKSEVRCVVITAGLPPKKLVEKWLTIRYHLKGRDDCPRPSATLVAALISRYKDFLSAWKANPQHRGGRKSLPNVNFLVNNFLLLESAEDYDLYAPWFPQVTENKRRVLWTIWVNYCRVLDWPQYSAEYDSDGKIRRIKQLTLL